MRCQIELVRQQDIQSKDNPGGRKVQTAPGGLVDSLAAER